MEIFAPSGKPAARAVCSSSSEKRSRLVSGSRVISAARISHSEVHAPLASSLAPPRSSSSRASSRGASAAIGAASAAAAAAAADGAAGCAAAAAAASATPRSSAAIICMLPASTIPCWYNSPRKDMAPSVRLRSRLSAAQSRSPRSAASWKSTTMQKARESSAMAKSFFSRPPCAVD